jgi:hypothetical protein
MPHVEESTREMPDPAQQLSGVAARLDAIHSEVTRLADHVERQNGRVARIENKCAAHDSISVSRTRTEIAVEGRMESSDERITALEAFRNQAAGAGKASLGILTQIMTILALALACWQYVESRPAVAHPQPPPSHQAVK